jgi:adenosylcobinamide kinase/adenosylcobinamide-phosphate guanylyltransferase
MSRTLTFILGGARSGKSAYALRLAAQLGGRVRYVATAEAGDDEMAARIAAHRAERPPGWETLEAPRNIGAALRQAPPVDVVVVDCLTLLANNVIVPLPEPVAADLAEAVLLGEIESLFDAYRASEAHWLIVSNELGLGLVPPYPLGRVYRDALGRANQHVAAAADNVLFMVAGLPLALKGSVPGA